MTDEQFVLVPQRTLEGRCCLLSPSQPLRRLARGVRSQKHSEGRRGRRGETTTGRQIQIGGSEVQKRHRSSREQFLLNRLVFFPPPHPTHPHFKPHCAPWSSCPANQEDAPILTLRVPMVYPVADIFGYFGGAVGALFLLLFLFLQYIPEICDRWEAAGLHGGDADPPGCQHPQSDQSPQRQLPLFAAGPVDHQRWLAWLFEVLFELFQQHWSISTTPRHACSVVLLLIT